MRQPFLGEKMRILEYISQEKCNVKQILKNHYHMTSGFITKLKYHGGLFVNGISVRTCDVLNEGDTLKIFCPKSDSETIECVEGELDILYEDEDVLCVNKPSGMPTHPSQNHHSDTLANIVYNYLLKTDDEIHIVTRLDNYTSGIVLIAKNSYSASIMCTKEYNQIIDKEYVGICRGIYESKSGFIDKPIARCDDSIIKRCVSPLGKQAKTGYEVVETVGEDSIVKFKLYTGRTHQIRVHCQSIGHPLLNDFLYDEYANPDKIFSLHCEKITFTHPVSGKIKTVSAKVPKQFYDDIF